MKVHAIPTDALLQLAGGLKPSTLNYWITAGLVTPSVRGSSGHRVERYWSVQDAVIVCTVRALRQAGCPLQRIVDAKAIIENEWRGVFSEQILAWDGDDLFELGLWGEVRSVWKRPGQLVLGHPKEFTMTKAVAMPVGAWRLRAEAALQEVAINE